MIRAIPGLASDLGAAVADSPDADRSVPPVVLVHGIHDNVRRWLHSIPGIEDLDWTMPTFDPVAAPAPVSPRYDRKLRLLEQLGARGIRGLAYSYQRPDCVGAAIRPIEEADEQMISGWHEQMKDAPFADHSAAHTTKYQEMKQEKEESDGGATGFRLDDRAEFR